MMRINVRITLLVLVGLFLLGACRRSNTTQNPNVNVSTPPQETIGGGAAPAGEKFYFRGWIASLSIEMTLVRDTGQLSGTYFYPRVGKNIDLKGSIDTGGKVELRESDETGKDTGVFKGQWKSDTTGLARIEGKWSRPDGSKETEFELTQQPIEFTAAVRVTPKVIRENNKEGKYTVNVEYPQIEGDSRFDGFNQQARSMVTRDVAAFKAGETESLEEGNDLPDETQTSTLDIGYNIRFATDDLISVEFFESQYERGAAHGSSITVVLNYDVKNRTKLALADLFQPKSNFLNVISSYCVNDLKTQSKTNDMLMEDQIKEGAGPRADNYGAWTITRKGLWITFDAYQVAAYAAGPQHVLVPYSALKSIVKPDGPIGNLAG
jgi:peptidoglycan-N-acetylglucosamine deacetylase